MMAITCATCGLFFDDFGAFEAHQIDTCRPKDVLQASHIGCSLCGHWVPAAQFDQHSWKCNQLAGAVQRLKAIKPDDWWRSNMSVDDAQWLQSWHISPL